MAPRQTDWLMHRLSRAALGPDGVELTDGQLLGRFLGRRDEAAFEALMRRHGPMVLGVCRRVLGNRHDAEDAFQATFLVLVRKAATIRPPSAVGNWLYGVAYRTALEAKVAAARRRRKERQVVDMARGRPPEEDPCGELRQILDQELSRLPDRYRTVIVLCDLEGKTQKEAARLLGCPEGTVAGRLSRARQMLARRLDRRGVALTSGGLTLALARPGSAAPLPETLADSTMKAVAAAAAGGTVMGAVSVDVISLTEGVLRTMLVSKLKGLAMILIAAGVLGGGAALMTYPHWAVGQGEAPNNPAASGTSAAPGMGKGGDLQLPIGPAPVQALARIGPDGRVLLRMAIPISDTGTAQKDPRNRSFNREPRTTTTGYRRGEVKVFDTQGREVDWAFLPRLLDPEAVVLVAMGDRPDPLQLRVFKEGLLVFVVPPASLTDRGASMQDHFAPQTRVVKQTRVGATKVGQTRVGATKTTQLSPGKGSTHVAPRE